MNLPQPVYTNVHCLSMTAVRHRLTTEPPALPGDQNHLGTAAAAAAAGAADGGGGAAAVVGGGDESQKADRWVGKWVSLLPRYPGCRWMSVVEEC